MDHCFLLNICFLYSAWRKQHRVIGFAALEYDVPRGEATWTKSQPMVGFTTCSNRSSNRDGQYTRGGTSPRVENNFFFMVHFTIICGNNPSQTLWGPVENKGLFAREKTNSGQTSGSVRICKVFLPSGKLTWLWKITIFDGSINYKIYKMAIFNGKLSIHLFPHPHPRKGRTNRRRVPCAACASASADCGGSPWHVNRRKNVLLSDTGKSWYPKMDGLYWFTMENLSINGFNGTVNGFERVFGGFE